jgi:hypothetical protein
MLKPVFSGRATQITPFPCPLKSHPSPLRSWLLLLFLPQRRQTNTRDLDDLESHTRNISLRLSLTTETRKEDLVVLVYEVETTVIGDCIDPWLAHCISTNSSTPQELYPILANQIMGDCGSNIPKAVTFFPFLIN